MHEVFLRKCFILPNKTSQKIYDITMKRIPRLRHNTTGSADLARTPKISTWTQQYMEYYQTKQTRKGGIHIKDVSIRFGEIFGEFSGNFRENVGKLLASGSPIISTWTQQYMEYYGKKSGHFRGKLHFKDVSISDSGNRFR